jgi:solute carrier family 25 aspartate/glutamate transporter 12/13
LTRTQKRSLTVKSAYSFERFLFELQLNAAVVFSRFLDREQFVNAIAPKGDLTRIGRAQFATLFRVADAAKRGLMSWDDFVVFQTLLKRPDADYYIAFQYFDVYARAHPCSPHTDVCCV